MSLLSEQNVEHENVDAIDTSNVDEPHVLQCAFQCWKEYEQYFDPHDEVMYVGPATTEPKQGIPLIDCSCGEHFTDQSTAIEHVITANKNNPSTENSPDTTQQALTDRESTDNESK